MESTYIYSLYQAKNGSLYIGTSGSGLLIYDFAQKLFTHYYSENCALISNNIYTILSDADKELLMGTENGLTSFYPQQKKFYNWTKDMGLMTTHFNALSGVLRRTTTLFLVVRKGLSNFIKI